MKLLFTPLFILLLLSACSKPKDSLPAVTIDMPEVQMYYDGSHQIVLNQGSVRVDASTYTWSHSNPNAGSLSSSGLFTAKHIGETQINGTSKTNAADVIQAKYTVKPYYTTWGKVVTDWGLNKASVKLAETRSLQGETSTNLVYYGENDKVRGVIYLFDANKLSSVGVLPENSTGMGKEVAIFLKERYDYLGSQNDVFLFTDNKVVTIALTVDAQLGLFVGYLPYVKGGRLAVKNPDLVNSISSKVPTSKFVDSRKKEEIRSQIRSVILS